MCSCAQLRSSYSIPSPIPMSTSSATSSSSSSMEGQVLKGRRTKRHRLALPPPSSTTTEEEEDLAKCLILLAGGKAAVNSDPPIDGAGGFYVYECKTCSKRFPSFQALGGHRASHKKPKTSPAPAPAESDREQKLPIGTITVGNHEFSGTHKTRVHECSICGSEFSSGQALGGHMRRHRPVGEAKKEKMINHPLFSLDLNLPAPSDDERQPETVVFPANSVPFSSRKQQQQQQQQQPLLFTATALVDCHY